MAGLAARLRALEQQCAPQQANGPYVNKPMPGPEWWAAFEAYFVELWNAPDYLRYTRGDEPPEQGG